MEVKEGKAYEYAKWCITETEGKVPEYVKKQAESWLHIADGEDPEAFVDENAYEKICKLLKIMNHPDLHCPIYDGLEEYAWLLIVATLCTKCRGTKQDIRFYTTALLEIARKNLSSELKNAIRKIIKVSPDLYDELEPAFKLLRSQIICLINDNEYTPLAYSQDGMDGKLANAFLADEAGALDDYPVEAMRSSQITLFNKLGIIISTQYPNDNNVMIDEIDIAKKVLDGLLEDRRTFALLYEPNNELQQGDIWMKEDKVLYQSNPVAVTHEYIFAELQKKRALAILYENKRENFLCKHCNILYKGLGVEGFIDIQKVRACRRVSDPAWWKGRRVWIGLDLSQTEDNTAVAMATREESTIYARVMGFLPEAKRELKSMKEKVDYKRAEAAGECIACGDEVVDYGAVERYILTMEETYGVEIQQVGYDRWNALSTIQKLEEAGITCVEIKQHSSVLHMPTKLLKEAVLGQKFVYDANRLLEINFQNARCTEDTNLNKYVNKKKSAGKVDMVVSLINAVYLLQQDLLYGSDNFVVQIC